jgi:hypothetical protein
MGKRLAYFLPGFAIGLLILSVIWAIRKPHHWGAAFSLAIPLSISCGTWTTYIAERKGKVKSVEELRRPLTLFPRDPA